MVILIIVYSIYIKFDLVFLILILIVLIVINSNLSELLIERNSYIKYIKNKFNNYFDFSENFKNNQNTEKDADKKLEGLKKIEETINELKIDKFDFKPYENKQSDNKENNKKENNKIIEKKENDFSIDINDIQNKEKKKEYEPFKENVINLRNTFQEIENNFKKSI